MSAASNVDDARVRASRALEAFEKLVYAHASEEAAKNFLQVIICYPSTSNGDSWTGYYALALSAFTGVNFMLSCPFTTIFPADSS